MNYPLFKPSFGKCKLFGSIAGYGVLQYIIDIYRPCEIRPVDTVAHGIALFEIARRIHQGFGDIYTKDKYLLVKTPFINEPEIVKGLLEGLLEVKLDLKNSVPPLVFEVQSSSLQK